MSSLNSRVVVISGVRGGIGTACKRFFEERGWVTCGFDIIDGDDLLDTERIRSDLSHFERVDALIHAAGATPGTPHVQPTLAEFDAALSDNLLNAYSLFLAVEPLLAPQSSIAFMSSVNGRNGGSPYSGPAYAASKAGLIGLTRYLSKHLAERQVRVNALAPGPVDTPMLQRLSNSDLDDILQTLPFKRLIEPIEIAKIAHFLTTDAARNINGAVLDVNGGSWIG